MGKVYFGAEAEKSIKDYLRCKDSEKKKEIYVKRIQPAFSKLTENIINMPKFNFRRMDNFPTLHDEVMSHLYSCLEKFNPKLLSKKTGLQVKAFSFFGTIAKNYLVQKSKKREKMNYILEDANGNEIIGDSNIDLCSDSIEKQVEMNEFLKLIVETIKSKRDLYENDKKKVADAIIYFLSNSQKEFIYNKKHFYLILREYTGLPSKQITVLLNEFKSEYELIRTKYYKEYV